MWNTVVEEDQSSKRHLTVYSCFSNIDFACFLDLTLWQIHIPSVPSTAGVSEGCTHLVTFRDHLREEAINRALQVMCYGELACSKDTCLVRKGNTHNNKTTHTHVYTSTKNPYPCDFRTLLLIALKDSKVCMKSLHHTRKSAHLHASVQCVRVQQGNPSCRHERAHCVRVKVSVVLVPGNSCLFILWCLCPQVPHRMPCTATKEGNCK